MRKTLAVAVVAMLLACGGTDEADTFPDVRSLYSVGTDVVCDGSVSMECDAARCVCAWERVSLEGRNTCYAVVIFERPDAASPWEVVAEFDSAAACD
jgi:hypothetical protein